MPKAIAILAPNAPRERVIDTLILDSEHRRTPRATASGIKGTLVFWDFPPPVALRTDDMLALEDGTAVEIVAAAEPLFEVRGDVPTLARIAWALGDRHIAVQVLPNRIRLRFDAGLEPMLTAFSGAVTRIEAPFEPEGGAYAHAHDHAHSHHHGHAHHHHDH